MTTVRPIRPDQLERALGEERRATAIWCPRLAGVTRGTTVSVNGIGNLTLCPERFVARAPADPESRGGPVWFAGAAGAAFDRFAFDGAIASSFYSALLGLAPPAAARAPSALERGLLAAAAVPLLGALGLPGALSLRPREDLRSHERGPALELSLRWPNGAGRAWIVATAAARSPIPPLSYEAAAWLRGNVCVVVTCELARASVAAAQWAAAVPGDAIVFPIAPRDVSSGRSVVLRFAGYVAPASLDDRGDVRLLERPVVDPNGPSQVASRPHQPGVIAMPDPSSPLPPTSSPSDQPSLGSAQELLAAATVELVAEVGRTTLRGEELVGLLEGAVLGLGAASADLVVTLSCGGRPVARGTLVDVEGELGVRLTARLG